MTDVKKLRDGDDLAARLLRAGAREEPRPVARRRAERALGLSAVAAGAALTSTAAAAGSASVTSTAPWAIGIFGKWLAVGVLAGGAAAGGVSAIGHSVERAPMNGASTAAVPSAPLAGERRLELPGVSSALGSLPPADDVPPDQKPEAEGAAIGQRQPPSSSENRLSMPTVGSDETPAAAASGTLALSREVELLEAVRTLLRGGNSGAALAELDAVDGDIQTLRMEADLLRVEALLAQGKRARAEALAAELQRKDPRGGQTFRLKRLLGDK